MKSAIYYFTRTGVSEKIAKEIGAIKNAEIYKITDNINWNGIFGYIKAAFYAVKKKSTNTVYRNPQSDEQIILVMPLWAESFPPAVRTFIDKIGRDNITLVVTSLGSKLVDREGFKKVIDVVGKNAAVREI